MLKSELIEAFRVRAGITTLREADRLFNEMLNTVTDTLASGEKVCLRGLGTFNVKTREKRKMMNPATGTTMDLPVRKSVLFVLAKTLKERMNA